MNRFHVCGCQGENDSHSCICMKECVCVGGYVKESVHKKIIFTQKRMQNQLTKIGYLCC